MMGLVESGPRQVHTSLPWEFVPQQRRVVVGLGERRRRFQWGNHLKMVVINLTTWCGIDGPLNLMIEDGDEFP